MWDSGASVSRSLFSRGHERHVFLFEKVIIFSKKIETSEEKKRVRNCCVSVCVAVVLFNLYIDIEVAVILYGAKFSNVLRLLQESLQL